MQQRVYCLWFFGEEPSEGGVREQDEEEEGDSGKRALAELLSLPADRSLPAKQAAQ